MEKYELPWKFRRALEIAKKHKLGRGPLENEDTGEPVEFNTTDLPSQPVLSYFFYRRPRDVDTKTFIIPVTKDAVVSGYFFEKRSAKVLTGLSPLIIYFHGGGWVWGNMPFHNYYCSHLADAVNASVLSIDYRLAPSNKFPTAAEDCYAALNWALAGARYWKNDPDKVFLMGECAGANLAAAVSRFARDRKGPKIAGQILVYPITDCRMRTESYDRYPDCPSLSKHEMNFFIQSYVNEPKDILDPMLSPLLAKDHSRLPPSLIFGAEWDPLHDDAQLYAAALASADTPVKYFDCEKTVHGYLLSRHAPATGKTESAIRQFVGGRPIEQIVFATQRELDRRAAQEIRRAHKLIQKNHPDD